MTSSPDFRLVAGGRIFHSQRDAQYQLHVTIMWRVFKKCCCPSSTPDQSHKRSCGYSLGNWIFHGGADRFHRALLKNALKNYTT